MARYTEKIVFRVTKAEGKSISEQAQNRHISVSEYVRQQTRTATRPADDPKIRLALQGLIYEVNKIGVNVNQITKRHNSHIYSKEDKEQLAAQMEKLEDLLEATRELISKGK